jgi:hypothetical protein
MDQPLDISQGNMAYDLRQRYAKIVGDHLEDITEARKNRDYPEYFRALEDLYTIVFHKFKTKKDKKDKEEKKNTSKENYETLKKNAVALSNKFSSAWLGQGNDPKEIGQIESALRAMERFLYFKMNEASMFGSKRDMEGLY